jgi:hypothetical protein
VTKRALTKQEKAYRDYVGRQPCLVCGGASTLHHVTGYADRMGRLARREDRIAPLCPMHHQKVHDPSARNPVSVEGLNHRGFFDKHGIDLMAEAERLWNESEET